jgi:hypothetical protein
MRFGVGKKLAYPELHSKPIQRLWEIEFHHVVIGARISMLFADIGDFSPESGG